MSTGRIIVGVDGRESSSRAAEWAARECMFRGGELLLVHALEGTEGTDVTDVTDVPVSEYVTRIQSQYPNLTVRSLLSHDSAADVLVDASADAALVVLGSNGPADVTKTILGSVANRVAVHSHCPVVVLPYVMALPDAGARGGIVAGLAPTQAGRLALRFALAEAQLRKCAVTGVHGASARTDLELDKLAGEVNRRDPFTSFTIVRSDEDAATALLAQAKDADLLVLGCHHSSDPWSARLGDVPAAVLARIECPVVLVGQQP